MKILKIIAIIFSTLFFIGCSTEENIENNDYIIIDVRTSEEFEEGHISDALNISHDVIRDEISSYVPDKNEKIYLYCRSGNRSSTALKILNELGYDNVIDLGGFEDAKDFFDS